MILQLNPTIPMFTPKGRGLAHFIIDYSIEHHLMYVVALDSDGSLWTFQNPDVRVEYNPTIGRIAK